MKLNPSIFNDVIGPVMRGPSSSHCAASLRIGRLCRDLMDAEIEEVYIEFDVNGSLATTHESQGSDMGLFGGFLGWDADDERLADSSRFLEMQGIKSHIHISDFRASHPNTYKITLRNRKEERKITAISTGGGMIEITQIDGADTSLFGDKYVLLIYSEHRDRISAFLRHRHPDLLYTYRKGEISFLEVSSSTPYEMHLEHEILAVDADAQIKYLDPVLPVLSAHTPAIPFLSCKEMLEYNVDKELTIWELAVHYEQLRGSLSTEEVYTKMNAIAGIMRNSIDDGLKGTHYEDRILGPQSLRFKELADKGKLLGGDLSQRATMYVSAIMEVKSSMGVIVAAPTAGSCGVLPGTVFALADSMNLSGEMIIQGLLTGGLIGLFITEHATFAAEVGGCQAECGAGSSMAAAAVVHMAGGSLEQCLCAASMALQNSLGMICDPIANRVEAPCLGKNVMASSNALACANMALAGYDHLIPLDEVIFAMAEVAHKMDASLRCTGLGGLAATKTAKSLEQKMGHKVFFKSC